MRILEERAVPAEGTTDTKALRQGQARLLKATGGLQSTLRAGCMMGEGQDAAEIAQGQVTRTCGTVDRIWLSYRKGPKTLHGLEQRKGTTDHEERAAAGRPVRRLLQ